MSTAEKFLLMATAAWAILLLLAWQTTWVGEVALLGGLVLAIAWIATGGYRLQQYVAANSSRDKGNPPPR